MRSGFGVVMGEVKISCAIPLGPAKRHRRSTPRNAASSVVPSAMGTPRFVTRLTMRSKVSWSSTCQPEGHQVLGGSPLDEEAALLVVEPEPQLVPAQLVDMEADGVGAEAVPLGEALRLDDDVAEVDRPEDVAVGVRVQEGDGHRRPPRNETARSLKRSARSHCAQCPVLAAT